MRSNSDGGVVPLKLCIFAVFLSLSFAFNAFAQDEGAIRQIEISDALAVTLARNPDIQAAKHEYFIRKEQIREAMSGWLPQVNAQASVNYLGSELTGQSFVTGAIDNTSKQFGITLEQPLFTGFEVDGQVESARYLLQAEFHNFRNITQDIVVDAATAYMDVLLQQFLIALNAQNVKRLQEQTRATSLRFEVGELTRTDVAQTKAALASAQAELRRAKGDLAKSRARFKQITLMHEDIKLLEPYDPDFALPLRFEDALMMMRQNNPELQSLRFSELAAQEDIDARFGALLPKLDLTAGYDRAYDPDTGAIEEIEQKQVGLRATLPLYQGGANRSRLRQARITANQRVIELQALENDLHERLTTAWEDWHTAKATLTSRQSQLKAASIAQEGTYKEMMAGLRIVLDSLDANQDLLQAQTDLAQARRDEIVALYALAGLLGLVVNVDEVSLQDQ